MPMRFDPHRSLAKVVVYSLAVDDAIRFLHWLFINLIHEFGR
jgi:hypothetical protein